MDLKLIIIVIENEKCIKHCPKVKPSAAHQLSHKHCFKFGIVRDAMKTIIRLPGLRSGIDNNGLLHSCIIRQS